LHCIKIHCHKMTRPIVAVNDLNVCLMYVCLSQTRFFRRNITPFLDNWLLDLPGVGSGPGADLLGDINAFFLGFKLGHQFGDVLAGTLGLQRTLFLGSILDNGLGFVITFLSSLSESTASRSAKFPGFLSTSGDGRVLLDILLGNGAHLLGPLAALGVGGVATGLILTLLLIDSFTFNNIIFNIMFFLLGPALALVLGTADFGSLDIAILHKRSTADLDSFVESDLLVFNEAVFPEVFVTLFLLLGFVVGGVCGVAPFVIRVITLNNIIIFGLFDHLNFVNATLASRFGSSSYIIEARGTIFTLEGETSSQFLRWLTSNGFFVMSVMIVMMSMISLSSAVEWESVQKRSLISGGILPELASGLRASNEEKGDNVFECHAGACR